MTKLSYDNERNYCLSEERDQGSGNESWVLYFPKNLGIHKDSGWHILCHRTLTKQRGMTEFNKMGRDNGVRNLAPQVPFALYLDPKFLTGITAQRGNSGQSLGRL